MADQSAFAVTTERIDTPVYRITVGWGDMGRTWVVSLPGSMSPDTVEHVVQTMRRAVGAAVEETRRESAARIVELEREVESRAFDLDPAMVQARNDTLNAELEETRNRLAWFRERERQWSEVSEVARQHLAPFTSVGMCHIRHGLPVMAERLKAALADVERLTKEREAWLDEDTRWMQRVMGLEIELRRVTAERDTLKAKLDAAQRLWESMKADKAERGALKASKTAAPTCERCGTQLDTWCERCDVGKADEPTSEKAGG